VIVDPILKAGIAGCVGARLALKHDGASVRHEQTGPNQEHARLPERDLAIVYPDQSSALWDQSSSTCGRVIDVFGDLRGDLARQIGADPSDESGWNSRPCLDHEGRRRLGKAIGTCGTAIDGRVDESELPILPVLSERLVRR